MRSLIAEHRRPPKCHILRHINTTSPQFSTVRDTQNRRPVTCYFVTVTSHTAITQFSWKWCQSTQFKRAFEPSAYHYLIRKKNRPQIWKSDPAGSLNPEYTIYGSKRSSARAETSISTGPLRLHLARALLMWGQRKVRLVSILTISACSPSWAYIGKFSLKLKKWSRDRWISEIAFLQLVRRNSGFQG